MGKSLRQHIIFHCVLWILSSSLYVWFRLVGVEKMYGIAIPSDEVLPLLWRTFIPVGIVLGFMFGSFDYYLYKKLYRSRSIGALNLMRVSIHIVIVVLMELLISFTHLTQLSIDFEEIRTIFNNNLYHSASFIILTSVLSGIIIEVDNKFGPGNLLNLITGKYHQPREEERIFMFLDLKSSTGIAEKLGHRKYSEFIQDCFKDLSVIKKYKAEIYQYAGDEVVLTWSAKKGLKHYNCLRTYFAFQNTLAKKALYYKSKYGIVPVFKAGVNIGIVTAAEIGEIKREIQYFGDTINTAARIESQCSPSGENLLVSKELVNRLPLTDEYVFDSMGEFELKGKEGKVELFGIHERRYQLAS